MYRIWIQMCVLLGGYVVLPGPLQVNGIEIFTSSEVEAVNGTNVRLKCTFKSKLPISSNTVTVSWTFHPLAPGPEESVYYYQETAYPPTGGRFKDHAVWSGDIAKQDASITLHQVPPTFNGTYICQVQNKPDVHGKNGEIVLKVVNKVALSDLGILAAAVGGACGLILILLGIFVWVRYYRKKRPPSDTDVEMHAREQEWKDKDPTVCNLEEAIHLKTVEKEIEVESSDEESEASSGDDEEEGDGGEEEDDDDDDGGGGDDDD